MHADSKHRIQAKYNGSTHCVPLVLQVGQGSNNGCTTTNDTLCADDNKCADDIKGAATAGVSVSFTSCVAIPVLWQGRYKVFHVPEVQSTIPSSALLVGRRLILLPELIHGACDLIGGVCKVLVPQGHPHVICLSQQVLLLLGFACSSRPPLCGSFSICALHLVICLFVNVRAHACNLQLNIYSRIHGSSHLR